MPTTRLSFVSPAVLQRVHSIPSSMSLKKILNNTGPNVDTPILPSALQKCKVLAWVYKVAREMELPTLISTRNELPAPLSKFHSLTLWAKVSIWYLFYTIKAAAPINCRETREDRTGLNRVVNCSYRTKFQLLLCVDRSYIDVTEQDKMFQIHCSCSGIWSNLVLLHHLLLPEEARASGPARDYLLKHTIWQLHQATSHCSFTAISSPKIWTSFFQRGAC